jgi:SAM-dependent methyltransferase
MPDWEEYAETHRHDPASYLDEPPQRERVERTADRCGPSEWSVLDVGASDGFCSYVFQQCGHPVQAVDISPSRVDRIKADYGIEAEVADAAALPYPDGSFDVVVLGEVLEHCPNPGLVFAEACRVARERVVISVPLNGWADPTHEWRISIDRVGAPNFLNPTKGEQAVITWQRGRCWSNSEQGYFIHDEKWKRQFLDEAHPVTRIQ